MLPPAPVADCSGGSSTTSVGRSANRPSCPTPKSNAAIRLDPVGSPGSEVAAVTAASITRAAPFCGLGWVVSYPLGAYSCW